MPMTPGGWFGGAPGDIPNDSFVGTVMNTGPQYLSANASTSSGASGANNNFAKPWTGTFQLLNDFGPAGGSDGHGDQRQPPAAAAAPRSPSAPRAPPPPSAAVAARAATRPPPAAGASAPTRCTTPPTSPRAEVTPAACSSAPTSPPARCRALTTRPTTAGYGPWRISS